MLERDIEKKLSALVRARGGLCYKFVSPGNDGVPDRIIITPKGQVWFVELKTEAGRLSRRQKYHIERLRSHYCSVLVTHGWEETERLVKAVFDCEV